MLLLLLPTEARVGSADLGQMTYLSHNKRGVRRSEFFSSGKDCSICCPTETAGFSIQKESTTGKGLKMNKNIFYIFFLQESARISAQNVERRSPKVCASHTET